MSVHLKKDATLRYTTDYAFRAVACFRELPVSVISSFLLRYDFPCLEAVNFLPKHLAPYFIHVHLKTVNSTIYSSYSTRRIHSN